MNNPIGIMLNYRRDVNLMEKFEKASKVGILSCQLSVGDATIYTDPDQVQLVLQACKAYNFTVSAVWAGLSGANGGPGEWNFTGGPSTIGLVPASYPGERLQNLRNAAEFAEKIGVSQVVTHVGFLPEDPNHPDYVGTVTALRWVCNYMKSRGQYFLFETGQETPVTLLRAIQDIGTGNVGINLDTANLILYGKGNTLDSLDVFGQYVMNTHIKDGFYPTDGRSLGVEVAAGKGKANIPAVVKRLGELGYQGHFTIEREIIGAEQDRDVLTARDLLLDAMKDA